MPMASGKNWLKANTGGAVSAADCFNLKNMHTLSRKTGRRSQQLKGRLQAGLQESVGGPRAGGGAAKAKRTASAPKIGGANV